FVAYAVASGLCGRRERFEITFWAAVLVALISLSRVFLGVHFATDVAGGFLLGGSWLLVGLALAVVRSGSPPSHSQ
ncbi:MAG TPA: phosphatase PAP2 family protein, partial [Rhodopila sp.]|nr:phosphatase PAP2 family protein [Rhodopila sp.]